MLKGQIVEEGGGNKMVYRWGVFLLGFLMLIGCSKVLETDIQKSISPSEAKQLVIKKHHKDNIIITNIEIVDNEYIISWKNTDSKSKRLSGSDRVTEEGVETVTRVTIVD